MKIFFSLCSVLLSSSLLFLKGKVMNWRFWKKVNKNPQAIRMLEKKTFGDGIKLKEQGVFINKF